MNNDVNTQSHDAYSTLADFSPPSPRDTMQGDTSTQVHGLFPQPRQREPWYNPSIDMHKFILYHGVQDVYTRWVQARVRVLMLALGNGHQTIAEDIVQGAWYLQYAQAVKVPSTNYYYRVVTFSAEALVGLRGVLYLSARRPLGY